MRGESLYWVRAYNSLPDLFTFYSNKHEPAVDSDSGLSGQKITISSDGVKETNVQRRKLHIITIMFEGCRSPLPWMVWEYGRGHKPSLEELYRPIVDEALNHNVIITRVIADGLEQNFVRGMIATTGFYSCARCKSMGSTRLKGSVYYPLRDNNLEPKTHQYWVRVLEKYPNGSKDMTKDEALKTRDIRMGIEQRSPLLDLPGFDIVEDVCMDPMHMLHMGITKATWDRLSSAPRRTEKAAIERPSYRTQVCKALNDIYAATKIPSEMTHKTGNVHVPAMKAAEWQLMDMFCLTQFSLSIDGPEDLKKVFLSYSFLVRVLYIEDEVLAQISPMSILEKTVDIFLKAYARLFGETTFTFNLHGFLHFVQYRIRNGPVWTYSTGPFESMYSKAKQCYKGNTRNVPKQILQNFHAFQDQYHVCRNKKRLKFSASTSLKTDDSLVFYNQNFYRVTLVQDPVLTLQKLKTSSINTTNLVRVPWSIVGVRKYEGESNDRPITVLVEDVKAKAILCGDIISSMFPEWIVT